MKKAFLFSISLTLFTSGFSQSQNVGIGTTTPAFKLDVANGSINTDSVYRIGTNTVLSVKGIGNLFVGMDVGRINIGYLNTFCGNFAGYSNTTGSNNTFFGGTAGYNNISSNNNSFFGWAAGTNTSSGSNNSFFGRETGLLNTLGKYNTAIGQNALMTNIVGTHNTAVGDSANVGTGALTNATAIGSRARVDCDNCMVLGSVNNINGATSTIKVGIGVNSPNAKLSISTNGIELAGSATSNVLTTNAGALSSIAGSEMSLANIGFMSSNNSSLGVRAYRTSQGPDWMSTALLLEYDVDNSARVNSSFLALNANGNIGMGTATPMSKLHIQNGASGATPFVFSRLAVESSGHTYINLLSPAANETAILFGLPGSSANGGILYNNENTLNGFQFRANGNSTKMVLDAQGRLGIGNATPQFPLSFNGSLGDKISLWTDGSSTHYGLGVQSGLFQIFTKSVTDDIAFGYGNSTSMNETMRIKGNGKVGIGITAPLSALHVTSNSSTNPTCYFVNTSANGAGLWANCLSSPGAGTGLLGAGGQIGVDGFASQAGAGTRYGVRATANGGSDTNYGIRCSATGGDGAIGIYAEASGGDFANWAGYFSGNVYCIGTYQGSDRKLKNDIKPLNSALSIINLLHPALYTFKTNEYAQLNLPEGLHYGLIADEVQQVIPGAVKHVIQPTQYENNDVTGTSLHKGVEFDAVNYTEMIPILIAAVKEQQLIIEELILKNQKMDQQQIQLDLQRQEIDELKRLVGRMAKN